jgi:hypothetical protein
VLLNYDGLFLLDAGVNHDLCVTMLFGQCQNSLIANASKTS